MNLATVDCKPGLVTSEIFPDDFRFGPTTKTDDFICWTLERFRGWRTAFTTSFGMEKLEKFGSQTVFKRPGQPAELASIYVQLAANDASFTTGAVYGASGGAGQP